ncbi:hypothetical protein CAPTEDRAFT_174430 [Capitella teleta]|uniref:UBX domain-containing protein n=1 Tax=Capitella teleta TaxID=283909 RepID=R7UFW3_CAPTE|nr:hypothetical protein CAPTEDRAFT_174430 [Capitella teleta]|eukprot:ELU02693.1 hypothetical protein CAPTEDRAFT_174430 [Capitella teleta]
MAAIKKFFEKKKLDLKFKRVGGGHALTEDTKRAPLVANQPASSSRTGPSSESQMAARAALSRLDEPSKSAIQVKAEMDERKRAVALAETYSAPREVHLDHSPALAVTGVLFRCPMTGLSLLPRKEMEAHIEEFLLCQLGEEPELTTALMIHTLNKDAAKVKVCIETLCKYIDNVLQHPQDDKFCKIRQSNKAFAERVAALRGTEEFLQAAGFTSKLLPGPSGVEEAFWVLSPQAAADQQRLHNLKEALFEAEPIRPELDRNVTVYHPNPSANRMNVPEEFYTISPEELKREQKAKQEASEKLGMLRTKEMRQRERQRELRRYRYCLIRTRLPEGLLLQGVFKAHEKLSALNAFIRESLSHDWIPFTLTSPSGSKFTDEDENRSLAECDLAPAAVVNLECDPNVMREIVAEGGKAPQLKAELLQNVKSL